MSAPVLLLPAVHHPKHYDYVLLIGAPSVGKGKKAKAICLLNGYEEVGGSKVINLRLQQDEAFAAEMSGDILQTMNGGKLVRDEVMMESLQWYINHLSLSRRNLVIDGVPRSIKQAQLLGAFLKHLRGEDGHETTIALVSFENVDTEELIRRAAARTEERRLEGLPRRHDDDPVVVRDRAELYFASKDQIIAVASKYADHFPIDASGAHHTVLRQILKPLHLEAAAEELEILPRGGE